MTKHFQNERMMQIILDEITYSKWCKGLKELHLNRIKKGIKASTFIIPLVYEINNNLYQLDAYMPGKKAVKYNDNGEEVYTRMYRYFITKDTMEAFFANESLGRAYNIIIKQNPNVNDGKLIMDLNNPNLAPTRFDLAKQYKANLKI